jgi:arylsulfatase A-like enzyme
MMLMLMLLLRFTICSYLIVHIIADDLGWAEVGYHNKLARDVGDIRTPNLDLLAATGLELDRFYTEKICSPR